MITALDTLRSIDLTIDFADFDAKEKIKMIQAELKKYWQEHPLDDGQEGKGYWKEGFEIAEALLSTVPIGPPYNNVFLPEFTKRLTAWEKFRDKPKPLPVADGEGSIESLMKKAMHSPELLTKEERNKIINHKMTNEQIGEKIEEMALPSAVTGGAKDAVGFINWAMDNNYQCKLKNITGGYEWYIDDEDGVPVDYLSPEQLYQVYLSEGQPAQECPRCHGEGEIEKNIPGNEGALEMDVMVGCPECGGTGIENNEQ